MLAEKKAMDFFLNRLKEFLVVVGDVAQSEEGLPWIHEALGSMPSTA